ncbi:hypothetical protein AVEN_189340-1 [Araneus ventricosus]|uniref:Uncharacterized protein n=1 Tax=Araneus ventricosus TaxID=182803 RepID=A0A4Y2QXM0_ARAVE|nr:hypothetical protein AVEN_269947-1 [Araneus ventricosus]GBN68197.1 hypothetical protein AVEN_189340-1 [Araneus ventricosus]
MRLNILHETYYQRIRIMRMYIQYFINSTGKNYSWLKHLRYIINFPDVAKDSLTCAALAWVDNSNVLTKFTRFNSESAFIGVRFAIGSANRPQIFGAYSVASTNSIPVLVQLAHLRVRAFDALAGI